MKLEFISLEMRISHLFVNKYGFSGSRAATVHTYKKRLLCLHGENFLLKIVKVTVRPRET